MKLKNTERGFPAGEPNDNWTTEQFLALLENQYRLLTAPDGEVRNAAGATDADIRKIARDIEMLKKEIARKKAKLN